MRRRGNKRAGPVAIVIFVMIVALVAAICWLAAREFQKEPNGPPRGSETLPAQAAQGTVAATPPNIIPAR
jgi:flagellar basal body-associated protein FliL